MKDLLHSSAVNIAQAIRDKKVSSTEVVQAYLDRIQEVNPQLNAVVVVTGDSAMAQAREADEEMAKGRTTGPLHGVPMTIKDALETAGVVSTGGTEGRSSYVPSEDATVVKRLKAAGGIMLGKTNLPELSMLWESDNLVYGRCNNPYDLERGPGGSSGGEAAIIAAGGSPFGIGSDSGGSIRQPAHNCGIAGIKPTSGCVPRTGHFGPAGGILDFKFQVGPMARYVEDLILTLPIIAGPDDRDPAIIPGPLGDPSEVDVSSLRVSYHTDNGIQSPTAETVDAVKAAARCLEDAGARVEESLPECISTTFELSRRLWRIEGAAGAKATLAAAGTKRIHPLIERWMETISPATESPAEVVATVAQWDEFRRIMTRYMADYDVIISPVGAEPAAPHWTGLEPDSLRGFSYVLYYNLTGWPGAVVRGGTSPEGLPIGVQVGAKPWRDHVALAVAKHIESELGGWQPPQLG